MNIRDPQGMEKSLGRSPALSFRSAAQLRPQPDPSTDPESLSLLHSRAITGWPCLGPAADPGVWLLGTLRNQHTVETTQPRQHWKPAPVGRTEAGLVTASSLTCCRLWPKWLISLWGAQVSDEPLESALQDVRFGESNIPKRRNRRCCPCARFAHHNDRLIRRQLR